MKIILSMLCALLIISPNYAFSQEQGIIVDEAQGQWVAIHHSPDGGINTDACAASSANALLSFRSDAESAEIRSSNPDWNMTVGQEGDVTISAGSYSHIFKMSAVSNITLSSVASPDELSALFSALDNSSSATIQYGKKTTKTLSLAGSTRVLGAFRACSARSGFATFGATAGGNSPF